jgi:hypothetical protein
MTRLNTSLLGALALSGATLLWAGTSRAGIESCGNIDVEANAMCEVQVEGGCEATCEGSGFELTCEADLYAKCEAGDCDLTLPDCEVDCQGTCEAECDVDPGDFECEGSCKGECEADCSASCETSNNQSECEAACKGTCSGECSGSCEGTPPSADCEAKCQGSCKGQCDGRASFECQADCRAMGRADCEADMQLKCETQCNDPDGAVFCDGEYVDRGNNADECIAALNDVLNVEVEGSASSSGECAGNTCQGEAEAKGSAKCSVSKPGSNDDLGVSIGLLGLVAASAAARRRRG